MAAKKKEKKEAPVGSMGKLDREAGTYRFSDEDGPKLSTKQKAEKQKLLDYDNPAALKKLDASLRGMIMRSKKKFGSGNVLMGDEVDSTVIGIPNPSIALQYLLGINIIPLQTIYGIVGPADSNKTTFLLEIVRWIARLRGYSVWINNEMNKFNAPMAAAINRCDYNDIRWFFNKAETNEDWQEKLSSYVDESKALMRGTKEEPGLGRTFPVGFFLDSLSGTTAAESKAKIDKDGSASRDYAVSANLNTNFLKAKSVDFCGWPFVFFYTNHLKQGMKTDVHGNNVRSTPGGAIFQFLESYEIELHLGNVHTLANFTARDVWFKVHKNSNEEGRKRILARCIYWKERVGDKLIQKAYWDWDWALTRLITQDERARAKVAKSGLHFAAIKTSPAEATAWSKTLKIPKDKPVTWREMGKRIRNNPEVLKELTLALEIMSRPVMVGNYELQKAKEEAEGKKVKKVPPVKKAVKPAEKEPEKAPASETNGRTGVQKAEGKIRRPPRTGGQR